MDFRHITTDSDLDTATCGKCSVTTILPKDGTTEPKRRRVYLGRAYGQPVYQEVTDPRVRPDGSEGIPLPPKYDALVDFILAHKHDREGR